MTSSCSMSVLSLFVGMDSAIGCRRGARRKVRVRLEVGARSGVGRNPLLVPFGMSNRSHFRLFV